MAMPDRQDTAPATHTRRNRRVSPVPRPREVKGFEGKWVAVTDHQVIASSDTSHELALELRHLDSERIAEVVMQFVPVAAESYIVYTIGAG